MNLIKLKIKYEDSYIQYQHIACVEGRRTEWRRDIEEDDWVFMET
jgi:hypothetical protein